ncbi:MAG: hypothetical protein R3C69_11285 [Geminicoccaceae bacterium]
MAENGFREVTNSKVAIRTPADMAGADASSARRFNDIHRPRRQPDADELGRRAAGPSTGAVDCQENPLTIYDVFEDVESGRRMRRSGAVADPFADLRTTRRVWDLFTPEDQEISTAAVDAGAQGVEVAQGADGMKTQSLIEEIEGHGVTVVRLTDEERQVLRRRDPPGLRGVARRPARIS